MQAYCLAASKAAAKKIEASIQNSIVCCSLPVCVNLNCLLVIRQIDNHSPGGVTGGKLVLALTRDENFNTQSSDISAEEIRESGRSFQSLMVWGKKLHLYASKLAVGIWNAMECWFLQRLVLGTRSPVGILALPFRPLYSNMSRLSVWGGGVVLFNNTKSDDYKLQHN